MKITSKVECVFFISVYVYVRQRCLVVRERCDFLCCSYHYACVFIREIYIKNFVTLPSQFVD